MTRDEMFEDVSSWVRWRSYIEAQLAQKETLARDMLGLIQRVEQLEQTVAELQALLMGMVGDS